MSKIISFDIWDTIIKRKCHPEEIKLHVAKYILLKYENILKEKYKDIYEILKLRDNIEYEICQENKKNGNDDECQILEVFKRLERNIFVDEKIEISQELLEEEMNEEKKAIYLNPDILPIFEEYKDYKKYCISDFYMGDNQLKELLDYVKVPVKIEKIFSSADYLLNKRSGNLFKKAEEELKIEPKDHVHVGDNQYSDIEIPGNMGIKTIKMQKENIEFSPNKNRKFNFDFDKIKKISDDKNSKLFNEGIKLSPLLYFFGYSIVEYAIRNKINKVYYQTREGETFIKIHEMILKNNPFEVEVPQCDTLEVSRMATFSASLKEFSVAELLRLWSQYRVQSVKALFKTLAIDINSYKEFMGKYNIDINEAISEPWFDIRIQNLCKDKEFTNKIQVELDNKKKELLEYFEIKKNIKNDNEPMFVVDIGWRGTIHDNLCYIYPNKQIDGYYLTLFDYYNVQPKNAKKLSYIEDKSIRDNEISSILTLLEWIYNPGTGSVIEYKQGEAIRKAKEEETNIVNEYIRPLQEGMLAGAEIINEYMKYHPYEADESKKYVYEVIKQIKANPSEELIEAYYSMVFNDTFGTAEYVEKDDKLTLMDKINIFKCRNILRKESWKEAFIVYNNIGYMNALTGFKKCIRKVIGKEK